MRFAVGHGSTGCEDEVRSGPMAGLDVGMRFAVGPGDLDSPLASVVQSVYLGGGP